MGRRVSRRTREGVPGPRDARGKVSRDPRDARGMSWGANPGRETVWPFCPRGPTFNLSPPASRGWGVVRTRGHGGKLHANLESRHHERGTVLPDPAPAPGPLPAGCSRSRWQKPRNARPVVFLPLPHPWSLQSWFCKFFFLFKFEISILISRVISPSGNHPPAPHLCCASAPRKIFTGRDARGARERPLEKTAWVPPQARPPGLGSTP